MKEKNSLMSLIYEGVIKSNPSLVLMLGMCPTLAVTTSASNGFGMGVSTMAVLIVSNLLISLLRKIIPDAVRLPAYIVVVASLVTVVEMITQAYMPALYESLGLYIPLIVVNCIILGRAEAFASQNDPIPSVFDGIGMGLGFTLALMAIGSIRELLGAGSVFGIQIMPESFNPIAIFIKAPGAFLVIAFIIAIMNAFSIPTRANEVVEDCDGCCAHCNKCPSKEKEV
ncbi:MAG: electron transport complex subunit E [Lachnospiraceae bacterium]|nr:electron transport complex subunit E [Lachnospiraceae bacterium]